MTYNCRAKEECLLNATCYKNDTIDIYVASKNTNPYIPYLETAEQDFKTWYYNHKIFKNWHYEKASGDPTVIIHFHPFT